MITSASWSKIDQIYTDGAMETIRRCVSVMRGRGLTIDSAFVDLSYRFKITPRRVRTLFKNDGVPVVRWTEWDRLRQRAGHFFLEEAARLRELAKAYETVGEKMISDNDVLTHSELALIGDKRRAATNPTVNSICV